MTWANILNRSGYVWGRLNTLALIRGSHAPWAAPALPAPSIGQAPAMQDQGRTQPSKRGPSPRPTAGPGTAPDERPGQTPRASPSTPAIALRPATPADAEFCYQLHKTAMGDYITVTWGWDEQVQRAFHERAFTRTDGRSSPPGRPMPACWMSSTAQGRSTCPASNSNPHHQGHGIGTRIISALLDEAERTGQDLVLDVLTVNRRAQALYQRLGMTEVARHGDRDTKITMRSTRHRKQLP